MTIVIAHRTCPLDEAENSLAGIRRSAALGADVVEVDVRITADGVAVLLHDKTTRRTAGGWSPIKKLPYERVRRLRLRGDATPVPTLAEALDALPGGLGIAVDVKDPRAAAATLDEVRNQNVEGRTKLWAQDVGAVEWMARSAPDIEVALLRDTRTADAAQRFLRDATDAGARAISAHWAAATPEFVAAAHELGLAVYSWCRELSRQVEKLPFLDGLVTDWPREARAALRAGDR